MPNLQIGLKVNIIYAYKITYVVYNFIKIKNTFLYIIKHAHTHTHRMKLLQFAAEKTRFSQFENRDSVIERAYRLGTDFKGILHNNVINFWHDI